MHELPYFDRYRATITRCRVILHVRTLVPKPIESWTVFWSGSYSCPQPHSPTWAIEAPLHIYSGASFCSISIVTTLVLIQVQLRPELWQSDTIRSHFTNKCSLDNSCLLYLTCLHATLAMYVIDNVYFTLELATFRKMVGDTPDRMKLLRSCGNVTCSLPYHYIYS